MMTATQIRQPDSDGSGQDQHAPVIVSELRAGCGIIPPGFTVSETVLTRSEPSVNRTNNRLREGYKGFGSHHGDFSKEVPI